MSIERTVSPEETIDARELRVFLRVAELKSVTRAAFELRLAKSSVSKIISALEERMGVRLLERTSRRVEPTQAGQLLQRRARSLVEELDRLVADVREMQNEVRGQLTVAAPPDLAALVTRTLLPSFIRAHPGLRVALRADYGFADLQDPAIDVSIRVGSVRDDRLVARPIGLVRRILVASPEYARAHPLHKPTDLSQHSALVFAEESTPLPWMLTSGRRRTEVSVSGSLCARSFPVLLAAAEAGLGVTLVPVVLAQPLIRSGRLVQVLEQWGQEDAPILLVYRFGQHQVRRVAVFIEYVKQHFEQLSGLGA